MAVTAPPQAAAAPASEHAPVPAAALQAPWTATTPAGIACRAASMSDSLLMGMTPLEIDHAALAAFECPSFNEAEAVDLDLDGCVPSSSSWEMTPGVFHNQQQCAFEFTAPSVNAIAHDMSAARVQHETSFQALLQSDLVFLPPLQLDSQYHDEQEDEDEDEEALDLSDSRNRCSYRKGKCGQPRTRKLNGLLHTYCAFHRFRSIENQKQFDAKRRRKNSIGTSRSSSDSNIKSAKDSGTNSTPAPLKNKKSSLQNQEPDATAEAQGESIDSHVAHGGLVA
ncbi:hypothetical protein Gpo141_00011228 [Globisporangium polare]